MSTSQPRILQPKPIFGTCLLIVGLFMLLSLIDYDPQHSQFYTTQTHKLWQSHGNRLGYCGTYFAFYATRMLGLSAWLLPIYSLWMGIVLCLGRRDLISQRKLYCFILTCVLASISFALFEKLRWLGPAYEVYSAGMGGLTGWYLFKYVFARYFGDIGCRLILLPSLLFFFIYTFGSPRWVLRQLARLLKNNVPQWLSKLIQLTSTWSKRLIGSLHNVGTRCGSLLKKSKPAISQAPKEHVPLEKPREIEMPPIIQGESKVAKIKKQEQNVVKKLTPDEDKTSDSPASKITFLESEVVEKSSEGMNTKDGNYRFPPIQLLKDPPPTLNCASSEDYYETAQDLVQKLAEFGVEVKVEAIQSGPVITRYEVTPARGVRVEKITTLDKNIALGLKAMSVRIQAPVPGKGCVGIEIPNKFPLPVCLKEILESKAWAQSNAEIPIVLGKEVTGKPIVTDLTKMPHLLIAGSTGSGKTVCINAIIASLLFHSSPRDLRFIMVDPKIVEMKLYNDLPHMLIPVVTEPKRVPAALKWLIGEMERRYQLFANHGARNITTFNEKVNKLTPELRAEKNVDHLPYIVCIIDELADLMMVAPGDVETCIARLAQLARAAGIHLIIATQRPSVNVITGIIKANLPSRIAFKVASKVDSRTILDMGGADSLIGKGDMLFIPPGASQLIRAQGAWVSDEEINAMVDFLKCNGAPVFAEEVQRVLDTHEAQNDASVNDDEDDLIPQALEILKSSDRISTSLLQRRLKIGYNRAARIMETLEQKGLVPHGNPYSDA